MVVAIVTILLTILSAFLYRVGGMSKEQAKRDMPWVPSWLVNTKTRDVGCSALTIGWLALFTPAAWWAYLLTFVLTWAALTTYWDKIFKEDNFFAHGLGIALAVIAVAFSGTWLGFGVRCLVLPLLMGSWCALFSNDYAEEFGRGAFIIATLPLLLI